jgi:hypothetical protein
MDRNRFNREVRPFITEMRMGEQGVTFDRVDLDAWVEQYKSRNGRPGQPQGNQLWDAKKCRVSRKGPVSGTSTNASAEGEFARALEQVTSNKPKGS